MRNDTGSSDDESLADWIAMRGEGAFDGGNGVGRPYCLHSLQVLTANGALLGPGSDRYQGKIPIPMLY
jgi:hypothetical protein